jgi:hypothetical protein
MSFIDDLNKAQDFLNQNNPLTAEEKSQFRNDGFMLPSTFSADGSGLPSSKVTSERDAKQHRNIITWFVPEFGTVKMFINPQSITYNHKKSISKERTKGGYTLQYWGEELSTISINGTTGSSGIEGINVLYEIYRAEQYAEDAIGLSLAASNAASNIAQQGIEALGSAVGGIAGAGITGGLGGLLGTDPSSKNAFTSKNITTLAQLAFSVEMYYNGWVFRGYFDSMNIRESANDFLLYYDIVFMVTQKRGYRINYFPWTRSATDGPSRYNTPYSSNGMTKHF